MVAVTGPVSGEVGAAAELALEQVGQGQVVEHKIQKFGLGNLEHEVVLPLTLIAGLGAAGATATGRGAGNFITGNKLFIARYHSPAPPVLAVLENGLLNIPGGNADFFALLHI